MSERQDWGEINKPLPDPGPRDGKHGEGANWDNDEQGQSAISPDDSPPRGHTPRRFGFHRANRKRTANGG